jgi:hypothetical protein
VQKNASTVQSTSRLNTSGVYVHHILGIKATYAASYSFAVEDVQVGAGASYALKANSDTTFTIQTFYFDATSTAFAFGFQQASWTPGATTSQQVWVEFAPVVYSLLGISKLAFSGTSMEVSAVLNVSSNVLQINGSQYVAKLDMLLFALGKPPSGVCAPCDAFISVGACAATCPSGAYSYSFSSGGKTCRSCLSSLGQTLASSGSTCTCSNNKTYFNGNCYEQSSLPPTCSKSQLLVSSKCLDKAAAPSNLTCPAHAHANTNSSSCICDGGY